MLKSSGVVVLLLGFCITEISPLVSSIANSTSPIFITLLLLNFSSNSFKVKRSFLILFSSILPLFISTVGFPHINSLILLLFMFNTDITRCITSKPKIGIIPFEIGIPISVIGIDAKSAIIIDIASSNGCICPISRFPINLITINTII